MIFSPWVMVPMSCLCPFKFPFRPRCMLLSILCGCGILVNLLSVPCAVKLVICPGLPSLRPGPGVRLVPVCFYPSLKLCLDQFCIVVHLRNCLTFRTICNVRTIVDPCLVVSSVVSPVFVPSVSALPVSTVPPASSITSRDEDVPTPSGSPAGASSSRLARSSASSVYVL